MVIRELIINTSRARAPLNHEIWLHTDLIPSAHSLLLQIDSPFCTAAAKGTARVRTTAHVTLLIAYPMDFDQRLCTSPQRCISWRALFFRPEIATERMRIQNGGRFLFQTKQNKTTAVGRQQVFARSKLTHEHRVVQRQVASSAPPQRSVLP